MHRPTTRPSRLIASTAADHETRLNELRHQLLAHPVYGWTTSVPRLRTLMTEHVFAVWDFMSLLKRLQQIVTCCQTPWVPREDSSAVRFVNEIVLAEESDEDGHGGYASHFQLYLQAMEELNVSTEGIRQFIAGLERGAALSLALEQACIRPETRDFVGTTMQIVRLGQPHQVAAAFFYGREDVIPDMFSSLVHALEPQGVAVGRLRHYLQRHIDLDGESHGPLAEQLLTRLCAGSQQRRQEALATACDCLEARIRLWDGVLATGTTFA